MSNLNQMNPQALQALLGIASKKLGTTPEKLQQQLQDGTFEKALGNMPGNDAAKLKQALSNPKTAEKILSSPQAKAIYNNFKKADFT